MLKITVKQWFSVSNNRFVKHCVFVFLVTNVYTICL